MEKQIAQLRKREEYCRCSYSEIIRRLIEAGMRSFEENKEVG